MIKTRDVENWIDKHLKFVVQVYFGIDHPYRNYALKLGKQGKFNVERDGEFVVVKKKVV